MNNRERTLAVLRYQDYDRLPVIHFGYWRETLLKWAKEGHISEDLARTAWLGNPADQELDKILGWDACWSSTFFPNKGLVPSFEREILKTFDDGSRHVRNGLGVVILESPSAVSIPAEIDYTLTDRKSWEEHYKYRFEWNPERVTQAKVLADGKMLPFLEGGLDFLRSGKREYMYGLFCGSLFGDIRCILGVEGSSYLYYDDEELYTEIIDTSAEMTYQNVKYALESGAKFDFAHFWEDICFKNGPLVVPSVFEEKVGPHYRRITDLLKGYGVDIVSLDCDGMIDALIPTWLNNGVNTMFPIEVGTWNASIAPWREQYGSELRGVGGMNKNVFAQDKNAVDNEIERLRPLIELGGYIPCPDHLIPPEADFDTVRYYCQKMRELF